MQLDERPHQRQADAEAAARAVERVLALHEQAEDPRQHLARDADPFVLDAQNAAVAIRERPHADGPTRRRVLHRVGHQIQDDLVEAYGIGIDADLVELCVDDVAAGGGAAAHHAERLLDRLRQAHGPALEHDLAGPHARGIEQIVDEPPEVNDLTLDDVARLPDVADGARDVEHLRRAGDGGQRIAKLVAEHREEVILRAVGGLRLLKQQGALGLDSFAVGDVARDLRCTDDPAGGIADRRDGEGNGQPCAVLSLSDRLEMVDDLAAADAGQHVVLLRVPLQGNDQLDVVADGLRRAVAEHPLGGAVPAGDDAVERLADDRVVGRVDDGGQPRALDVFGRRSDHPKVQRASG